MDDRSEIDAQREPVNPYLDALSGRRPPEIAALELNLDPYANMVPRVSQRSAGASSGDLDADGGGRRHPWLVAISVLLIALMVLVPLLAEVFARLGI